MLTRFASFMSTVSPWLAQRWVTPITLLVDAKSGAPVGIQAPRANTPDGIWTPRDVTLDQVNNPTAAMLADLDATYRLNVAPYTRFASTGTALLPIGTGESPDGTTFSGAITQTLDPSYPAEAIGANSYAVVYSPLTIQNAGGLTVRGRLDVINRPA